MRASIEFEGKEYVMTKEPPGKLVQNGPVVLLGQAEVKGTVEKLRRYLDQFGPSHPKYEQRKAKLEAFLDLLQQGQDLMKKEG